MKVDLSRSVDIKCEILTRFICGDSRRASDLFSGEGKAKTINLEVVRKRMVVKL